MKRSFARVTGAGALAAVALAVGVSAQNALAPSDVDAPLETVVARALIDVIPTTDDADWMLGWDAVSIRARRMRWHLASPDADLADRPDGVTTRNGWIPAQGRSAGAVACGGPDGVAAIAVRLGGPTDVEVSDDRALIDALAAEGVEVELFSRPDPDHVRYRLAIEGRMLTELVQTRSCTPEGSRALRQCWSDYRLVLVLSDAVDPATMAASESCRVPGRG